MNTPKLTLESVEEVRKLLKQMGEEATPQNLAKELGIKKTEMMRYLNEGGYHFKITKWYKKDKYMYVVKEWLVLDQVFFDETDNPQNPRYLLKMKALHVRDLYFRRIEYYGSLLGWELRVDKKDLHEPEWRNTEDKIKAVRDAGLLKDTVFCFGDGWNEKRLGFRPEDRDAKVKELEAAGWKASFEGE